MELTSTGTVSVFIYHQDTKQTIDYTGRIDSITWSGDEESNPRTLNISMVNTVDLQKHVKSQSYKVGDIAIFHYNKKEKFRGSIWSVSLSSDGKEQFTAYDNLIYLSKSQDTVFYKNKTGNEIVSDQLKKAGIPTDKIADTSFKIKKQLSEGVSRSEIIKTALDETTANIGIRFKLRSELGKVSLLKRKDTEKVTIEIDNVISSSNTLSMEDLVTKVLVTKGSLDPSSEEKFVSLSEKNNEMAKKYGEIQHVINADEKAKTADMKKQAREYLKDNGEIKSEVSIEFVGHIDCITGNKIKITDKLSRLSSEYYISADTHTFQGGIHKMSLQLSRKLK